MERHKVLSKIALVLNIPHQCFYYIQENFVSIKIVQHIMSYALILNSVCLYLQDAHGFDRISSLTMNICTALAIPKIYVIMDKMGFFSKDSIYNALMDIPSTIQESERAVTRNITDKITNNIHQSTGNITENLKETEKALTGNITENITENLKETEKALTVLVSEDMADLKKDMAELRTIMNQIVKSLPRDVSNNIVLNPQTSSSILKL